MAESLLHADLTYYLRGVAFRVHNALAGGHPEEAYEDAFCLALDRDGIIYRRQPQISVFYKGKQVGEYRPDLMLADDKVLVDFKAAPAIQPLHKAQVLSYLAVTQAELGLILNFGASSMQIERLLNFDYLKELPIRFETHSVGKSPTLLFLVERCLLVGVVATSHITAQHTERLRWAMRETTSQLGLIANFYPSKLHLTYLRLPG